MKRLIYFISFTLVALSCSSPDKMSETDLEARIARIENGLQPNLQIEGEEVPNYNLIERLKELGIPGLSLAIVSNGEIEWARGYGFADVNEKRLVDTETLFLAGSISKPIAAIRAHQLVEDGLLSLDANVNESLTTWQLPENEFTVKEKVTLRRILNHTAGLTVWGFPGYDKGDTIPTISEVLDGLGNTDSVRVYKEPGESWMYSGGGYTIMQLMITDVEKMDFPEIMYTNVLNPFGMEESTFENPLPQKYHSIAATGYRSNGDEVGGEWPIYPEMAAAGLWTTPSQLIKYAIEVQSIHQEKQDGILKYETVEVMLTPGMNGHGLGPGVGDDTFGHGGADEGFRAQLTAWKDLPNAVVIMVNSDIGQIMREVMLSVAKEYDLPGIEPRVKKVVAKSDEELMQYIGIFEIDDLGTLEISIVNNHLIAEGDFLDETIHLLAENDTLFFDRSDGTPIDFNLEEGVVTGFNVQGLQALKVEE